MSANAMVPSSGGDPYASLREAFQIMASGAPAIAQSMVDVAVHGKSELARVQAATVVFDRIGLPAKVDVGVTAVHLHGPMPSDDGKGGAAETIAKRLKMLSAQARESAEGNVYQFPQGEDVVEAEVVEDE